MKIDLIKKYGINIIKKKKIPLLILVQNNGIYSLKLLFLFKILKELVPCIFKLQIKKKKSIKYNLSFFGFLSLYHYQKFQEIISFFEIFDNSLLPFSFIIYNKMYDISFITSDLFNNNIIKQNKLCLYKNNFNWIFFFLFSLKIFKKCPL